MSERWRRNIRTNFDWQPAATFPPGQLITAFGTLSAWCDYAKPDNDPYTKEYVVKSNWLRAVFSYPSRTVRLVYERGGDCIMCGRQAAYYCLVEHFGKHAVWVVSKDGVPMTQDHYVPKSKGGGGGRGNLNVMCYECNNEKGSQDPELFFGLVETGP